MKLDLDPAKLALGVAIVSNLSMSSIYFPDAIDEVEVETESPRLKSNLLL